MGASRRWVASASQARGRLPAVNPKEQPGFCAPTTPQPHNRSPSHRRPRTIEEALTLDTPDVATVLAIRGEVVSTWELR